MMRSRMIGPVCSVLTAVPPLRGWPADGAAQKCAVGLSALFEQDTADAAWHLKNERKDITP